MGLNIKQLTASLIGLGFSLGSEIVISGNYQQPTNPQYDPESGDTDPQFKTFAATAMLLQFSQKVVDGTRIRIGDERLLIQASIMTTNSCVPGSDDVFISDGITRELLSFTFDATKQLFIFHARRVTAA